MNDEKPLTAVGAYWIEEADYPTALQIFDDGNTLPRTWAEWRKIAEEMKKGLEAYGHPVMKVRINPRLPGLVRRAWHDARPAGPQAVRRRGGQGTPRRSDVIAAAQPRQRPRKYPGLARSRGRAYPSRSKIKTWGGCDAFQN